MQTTVNSPHRNSLSGKALLLLVVTVFLNTMGMTIIGPVVPFLVRPYVHDQAALAAVIGWLTSTYAICQFLAAPVLGALSDRYGRRPLLLLCLLGSAIGYVLFGLGGALWVLFLGRIIDGLTGGNFSILFAYIADRTEPEERGVLYGRIGAISGIGFLLGPAIGGFAARWGYATPAYLAAGLSLSAMFWGLFMLPESLAPDRRTTEVHIRTLNPFAQVRQLLALPALRWLLVAGFCYGLPFASLQATFGVFIIHNLGWGPERIGFISVAVGGMDILVQGLLVGRLLPRLGEVSLAILGFAGVLSGYLLISAVAVVPSLLIVLAGVALFAGSGGLVEPALGSLFARAAGTRAQGAVQGGAQSVQSLAMIIGPLWGGWLYARFGSATPYWSSSIWIGLAILAVYLALPAIRANHSVETETAISMSNA
ncbi:MAG: MFS transporter [Herpetosiphonaceae bacterium]|nr:MFS transporter [Herpetosiphonaceae bacterium]